MYLVSDKDESSASEADALKAVEGMLSPDEILFSEGEVEGPKIRYGYRVAGMRFIVPEGTVSELLHNSKIYHLPNAPGWLVGLINMHGNVMPVVDIASYAGVEISHLKKSNILAMGENENAIGVLIDGMPEAIKENESITDLSSVPDKLSDFISTGLYADGYYWFEFNIFDLFKKLALEIGDLT